MNNLTMSILGFPAVNRDLTVEVREPLTQQVVRTVKPFLDGTVRIPQIDPGNYEITLKHPNLTLPVLQRPIRVLPNGDTNVSVLIDPSKFRNTPIEDIPDANLEPVRALADSVSESVASLSVKRPGEAILAQDWNTMASALRDLANAVGELTRLVSPIGHNHPELEKKFDEVSGNFDELINSVTASLTELQRWGVVHRVWKPGERKEFFQAETDFWRMISKVFDERERLLADSVQSRLERATKLLEGAPNSESVRTRIDRVQRLLSFVIVAQTALDGFIKSRRVYFTRFGDLVRFPLRSLQKRRQD